ncbi:MAG: HAD family phosphatase [Ruminococcaceae bacterium]|nr:HAD family phosphatase [Oscillospiraceae bacterium]
MIHAVLFDMDGTLFDTERIYYRAWVGAAEAIGFSGDMDAVMQDIFGVSESDIGVYFRRNYGEAFPYERMLEIRAGLIRAEIEQNGVPLKAGAMEILRLLKKRGIAAAVVSSAPRFRIDDFLRRTRLDGFFSCIVSGERVAKSKPAPDIFLLAARELGVEASSCMVVEDSHNGVLAGARAGMEVVLIPDLQPVSDAIMPYVTHFLPSMTDLARLFDP